MEDSIWFQEELESSGLGEAIPTKSAIPETPEAYFDATFHHGAARVIADVPRWRELEDGAVQLRSYPKSRFVLLRLGIQLHPAEHTTNARYSFARCSAMLESDDPLLQPRVHDLYPSEIYNQPEAKISLAISPNLKIGPVEASAGTGDCCMSR